MPQTIEYSSYSLYVWVVLFMWLFVLFRDDKARDHI